MEAELVGDCAVQSECERTAVYQQHLRQYVAARVLAQWMAGRLGRKHESLSPIAEPTAFCPQNPRKVLFAVHGDEEEEGDELRV